MCGIAGIVRADGRAVPRSSIEAMCAAMVHRGPDGEGIHVAGPIGLGMRRLAIVDLASGDQPIFNEDKSVWVVFNGEIYGHGILRDQLEKLGHRFSTFSDTETIVHAYEEYGDNCVDHLRGMFAFALWDDNKKRLLIARDRVGKKPLYYANLGGALYFGSELAVLLTQPAIPRTVDYQAIWLYLSFLAVPAPHSAFAAIRKLEPGNILVWEAGRVTTHRYWDLDFSDKLDISQEEAGRLVVDKLRESVRLRMVADVPVGAFLSGGIDSSAVAALMAQESARPIQTFSIGFKERAYDELDHARRVAQHIGSDHHEFVVEPDAAAVLPELVEHFGEPYADSSAIPTYYVSRETRRHVTVALTGDGGDEAFGGYQRYAAMTAAASLQRVPGATAALRAFGRIPIRNQRSRVGRISRFASAASLPTTDRYLRWTSVFDPAAKAGLASDAFLAAVDQGAERSELAPWLDAAPLSGLVDAMLHADTRTYLPTDLLAKVDIASMAVSLEARAPFLDHEVLELAARLPAELKVHRTTTKFILKEAFAGLVPKENLYRSKMGFGVPVGEWLKGPLTHLVDDVLLGPKALHRGLFRPCAVHALVANHRKGVCDATHQIWALLMLELWFQRFAPDEGLR